MTILLWEHLIGGHRYPLWRDGQFYIHASPGIRTRDLWCSSRPPYPLHQLVGFSEICTLSTKLRYRIQISLKLISQFWKTKGSSTDHLKEVKNNVKKSVIPSDQTKCMINPSIANCFRSYALPKIDKPILACCFIVSNVGKFLIILLISFCNL